MFSPTKLPDSNPPIKTANLIYSHLRAARVAETVHHTNSRVFPISTRHGCQPSELVYLCRKHSNPNSATARSVNTTRRRTRRPGHHKAIKTYVGQTDARYTCTHVHWATHTYTPGAQGKQGTFGARAHTCICVAANVLALVRWCLTQDIRWRIVFECV